LRRLATHYHDRAGARAAMDELATLLDTPAHSSSGPVPPPNAPSAPLVVARGVMVRHAGATRDALHAADIALHRGQRVALVGPSGGGKSTLLDVLAGLVPPTAGELIHTNGLRIGYAPQRPFLFAGSLRDNLRMARPEASDEALRAAADAAQVLRFADRLPDGLDTVIGERGFGLSGGEARRVALARVFLRSPDLLLLDEPTAFLDPDTEAAVLQAIVRFAEGRCVVMATHSAAAMAAMTTVWHVRDGRLNTTEDGA
jgi:ATP-binding cassette subfamily C protein CydD